MQHTAGPWGVDRPFREPGVYVQGALTELICEVYEPATAPDRPHERDANARLIAAAPELLAALRRMLAYWDEEGCEHDIDDVEYNTLNCHGCNARAAIAKAEGKE